MACAAPAAPLTLTLLTPVVYVGSTCTVWTIKAREIDATCTVNDSKARNEICSHYLLLTAYLLTAYCLLRTYLLLTAYQGARRRDLLHRGPGRPSRGVARGCRRRRSGGSRGRGRGGGRGLMWLVLSPPRVGPGGMAFMGGRSCHPCSGKAGVWSVCSQCRRWHPSPTHALVGRTGGWSVGWVSYQP